MLPDLDCLTVFRNPVAIIVDFVLRHVIWSRWYSRRDDENDNQRVAGGAETPVHPLPDLHPQRLLASRAPVRQQYLTPRWQPPLASPPCPDSAPPAQVPPERCATRLHASIGLASNHHRREHERFRKVACLA